MNERELALLLLKESIDKCIKADKTLIERDMERASVSQIYFYMKEALKYDRRFYDLENYDIDCEYNRNMDGPKRTISSPNGTFPDLIIHKRLSNAHNILIVEFKMCNSVDLLRDISKLEDFTNCSGDYRYALGVHVILCPSGARYMYFEGGSWIPDLK